MRCLKASGCDPSEVDLLVVGTFTPDMSFPSTACLVQDRMKLTCPAFDLQAACAGFAYALVTASQFVAAGGLIAYGIDYADQFRLAASYADRILRGAKVSDLPVQQPVKFELVINRKAAKELGLTIPASLLATADTLID